MPFFGLRAPLLIARGIGRRNEKQSRGGRWHVTIDSRPPCQFVALNPLPSIAALLTSVLLLVGGNALIGVLTPVRARLDGLSELTVGLLGSVYFAGMLAGTLAAPAIVRRAGHIRAFAAFVALAVVAIVIMPVWPSPAPWLASRALIGFVFAGIYAVIEILDQRQGDQRQSRRALRDLPDRQFRRLGGRPAFAAALKGGGLSGLRGRRHPARARHRADGDDERRPARAAALGAAAPHLAGSPRAGLLLRRLRGGGGERRGFRARAGLRARHRHVAGDGAASSPRRWSSARRSASIRSDACRTPSTGVTSSPS